MSTKSEKVPVLIIGLVIGLIVGVGGTLLVRLLVSGDDVVSNDVEHACGIVDRLDQKTISAIDSAKSPVLFDLIAATNLAEAAAARDSTHEPLAEALREANGEIVYRFDLKSEAAAKALDAAREICGVSD